MTDASRSHYQYQAGGSLPLGAPTYVTRKADQDLYDALLAREYCYVLNARQMGKSSLRIRTMGLLQAQGITCADIELSGIGSQQITAPQWYGGLIQEIVSGFELSFQRRTWMQERADLSPVQRLSQFLETVLLAQIKTPLVIFIDEIDSVLGLSFPTDEFFGLIRHCYEKRATNAVYQRLTFVLLGVATPSDLMRSKQYSPPFNIGRAIALQGFQLNDCGPLIDGLRDHTHDPDAAVEEILRWSGGQPFLTQKLCWLVTQALKSNDRTEGLDRDIQAWVTEQVTLQIIQHWEANDEPEHLRTIRDRLLREAQFNPRILALYREILQRGRLPSQDLTEHLKLRLSGIVEVDQGCLRIKNPIYATIFNLQWVERQIVPSLPFKTGPQRWWHQLPMAIALGIGITSVIIAISATGVLERWELRAFDVLMRSRPTEGPDDRLFLVTVSEADVQAQPIEERGAASLSDHVLEQLLKRLALGKPSAIGLDIYRQRQVNPDYPDLAKALATNDRLFAICHYGDPGVSPPPEIPSYNHGFNSVIQDPDGVLRRQILAVSSPSPCQNGYAFNWWLATRYLQDQGIEQVPNDAYLQLGSTPFKQIASSTGGYRNVDMSGHQIMINYRATDHIAETMTLRQVFSEEFDPGQVTNRIVLIGVVAPSFNDHDWFTPYSGGRKNTRRMTGVEIQAHMTSQIISAVLDNRPLIWSWSEPIEWIWIGGWTVVASVIAMKLRSRRYLSFVLGGMVIILGGTCWIFICYAGWSPFFPVVVGILGSGIAVNGYKRAIAYRLTRSKRSPK